MGGTQQPRRQHADRVARLAPPPIPWGPPASSGNRSGDAPAVRPPSTPPLPRGVGGPYRAATDGARPSRKRRASGWGPPRDGPRTGRAASARTPLPAARRWRSVWHRPFHQPPPAAVECRGPAYFLGADYPSWMRRVDPARGSYTAASATLKPSPTTRCYLCTYCYLRGRGRGTRTVPRGGAAATAPPRDAPRQGSQPPWVGHSRERAVTDHNRTPKYSAVVPRVLYTVFADFEETHHACQAPPSRRCHHQRCWILSLRRPPPRGRRAERQRPRGGGLPPAGVRGVG